VERRRAGGGAAGESIYANPERALSGSWNTAATAGHAPAVGPGSRREDGRVSHQRFSGEETQQKMRRDPNHELLVLYRTPACPGYLMLMGLLMLTKYLFLTGYLMLTPPETTNQQNLVLVLQLLAHDGVLRLNDPLTHDCVLSLNDPPPHHLISR
jgi:hypothetical protein